jgi:hypothetical protein
VSVELGEGPQEIGTEGRRRGERGRCGYVELESELLSELCGLFHGGPREPTRQLVDELGSCALKLGSAALASE